MKEIKVKFSTLTPLWAGDAWGKCDELKLTGLIGSLRWWFEVLVRGMGYKACDSTGDKCQVEIKNPDDVLNIHKKICPVCYLFGTTGWKGRFWVKIEDNELSKPYNGRVVVKIGKRSNSWYYESGLMGQATLTFHYEDEAFPSILKILLYLISEHGMFSAKTSMGYGVVKFKVDEQDILVSKNDWENFEDYIKLFNSKFKENINYLPNLQDFFFVKFDVRDSIDNVINNVKKFFSYQDGIIESDVIDKWKDKNWCITSPVVRKEIRKKIKYKFSENNDLRHFLMGKVGGSNTRFSAIQVSHVYSRNNNLEFRIYGWLSDAWSINGKVNDIIKLLENIFTDVPWKEKHKRESGKTIKSDLLPSQIQEGICWNSSNKLLLIKHKSIKDLFNISEGHNYEV